MNLKRSKGDLLDGQDGSKRGLGPEKEGRLDERERKREV